MMLSNWLLANQDSILKEVLFHIARNQFRFQSPFFLKRVLLFLKPVEVEPGVLYELMETVTYNDITEDSKRWVFARPYNANASTLKLEDNKVRVIDNDFLA